MLDITVKRLIEGLDIVGNEKSHTRCTLIVKYGFDGTTAPVYKQKKATSTSDTAENSARTQPKDEDLKVREYIYGTFIVPLMLVDDRTSDIVWKCDHSNSPRYTRPLRINFVKEDNELCLQERSDIEAEIKQITRIEFSGFSVGFDFKLTMIDGKVRFLVQYVYSSPLIYYIITSPLIYYIINSLTS